VRSSSWPAATSSRSCTKAPCGRRAPQPCGHRRRAHRARYESEVSFDEGLRRTWDAFRAASEAARFAHAPLPGDCRAPLLRARLKVRGICFDCRNADANVGAPADSETSMAIAPCNAWTCDATV
jgi:hypothetical protein